MKLHSSLVAKGMPIEIDLNDVSLNVWNKVTGIIAEFNLDTGDNYLILHLPVARQCKIPTTSLEPGSYTLVLNLNGTSLCFIEGILIGVSDMENRIDTFSEAIRLRSQAAHLPPHEKAEKLRQVETLYRSLDLEDLADIVRDEIAELACS